MSGVLKVPLTAGLELVRAMSRGEGLRCRLEEGGRFEVTIGWDYHPYIHSHRPCVQAIDQVHETGVKSFLARDVGGQRRAPAPGDPYGCLGSPTAPNIMAPRQWTLTSMPVPPRTR